MAHQRVTHCARCMGGRDCLHESSNSVN